MKNWDVVLSPSESDFHFVIQVLVEKSSAVKIENNFLYRTQERIHFSRFLCIIGDLVESLKLPSGDRCSFWTSEFEKLNINNSRADSLKHKDLRCLRTGCFHDKNEKHSVFATFLCQWPILPKYPYKESNTLLKLHISSNLLLKKTILQKLFTSTTTRFFKLATITNGGKNGHWYLSTNKIHCSNYVKDERFCPFAWKFVQLRFEQTLSSLYDSTKFETYSFFRPEFDVSCKYMNIWRRRILFMIWFSLLTSTTSWLMWILVVVYRSTPKLLKNSTYQPGMEKHLHILQKPVCTASNDQQNRFTYEEHTSNVSMDP